MYKEKILGRTTTITIDFDEFTANGLPQPKDGWRTNWCMNYIVTNATKEDAEMLKELGLNLNVRLKKQS